MASARKSVKALLAHLLFSLANQMKPFISGRALHQMSQPHQQVIQNRECNPLRDELPFNL